MSRAERRRAERDSWNQYEFKPTTQVSRHNRRAAGKERLRDCSRMVRLRAGRGTQEDLYWSASFNWRRLMRVAIDQGMIK